MTITTKQILKVLYVLSWIIFVGVCVEAGGFIFNAFFTMVINPIDAKHFWPNIDFLALYNYDKGQFLVITFFMSLVAVMRAIIFYLIIKLLHDKELDMTRPFNKRVVGFILRISFWSLLIGLFSAWGMNYREWLFKKGIAMPEIQYMRLDGADVWLFMAVILFVIAQVFKRGIELQTENDLTV
ncbi:MAG: DUF2975 domain-containing protein [Chitinophagaceae bacterium]